jgi:hypothetical protein
MWLMLAKAGLSGLVILGVNLISRKNVEIGGTLAALPFISLFSLLWLSYDGQSAKQNEDFIVTVLWGYFPSAAMLGTTLILLKLGVPLIFGLLGGAVACAGVYWLVQLVRS